MRLFECNLRERPSAVAFLPICLLRKVSKCFATRCCLLRVYRNASLTTLHVDFERPFLHALHTNGFYEVAKQDFLRFSQTQSGVLPASNLFYFYHTKHSLPPRCTAHKRGPQAYHLNNITVSDDATVITENPGTAHE